MIRTAISPRFAIRTRANGRPTAGLSLRKDEAASERDVGMLLPRIGLPLVGQDLQGTDQPRSGLGRLDHLVDVAAGRRDVRVGELRLIPRDESGAFRDRVVGSGDL